MTSGSDMMTGQGMATPLRVLHDTQVSVEKFRIQLGNRVSAFQRGVDGAERPVPETYAQLSHYAEQMEGAIDAAIAKELKQWPVYEAWLKHVKGIGPGLSGQLLSLLLPVRADKGPSSWYKAAGLAPELRPDGMMRLPRPRAGEGKITYHPWLRRCLFNVATSFVRGGGYYREVYDAGKLRLQQLHAGDDQWPPHRIDSAARWRTVKLFLAHLWEAWCFEEGITPRQPYPVEKLNHVTYIPRPMPNGKGKI